MLRFFLHSTKRSLGYAGALAVSCSFYTECPCANQPTPQPTGAGGMSSGGAGGGGDTGGTSGASSGGLGNIGNEAGQDGGAGSPDPGTLWVPAVGDLAGRSSACGNINFLSAKPDEDLLIVGVNGFGLWASRDGGETWKGLGTSATSALIENGTAQILYDPERSDTFWEAGIYGASPFRTDDGGKTFVRLGNIDHNDRLSIDFTDPYRQLMLAGGHEQPSTLYRSTDGGESWENLGEALPTDCMHSSNPIIVDSETYLLGCRNGIIGSVDAGETWETRASIGGAWAPLIHSSGTIYWLMDFAAGLVKSSDNGETWERVVGAGVIASVSPIELPDGSLAAVNNKFIVRSIDEGVSWEPLTAELPFAPGGFVYSTQRQAFFAWQSTCETTIPEGVILRYDIAF
jgi:photosystem II stability/assembly factor-like uncharacterized protein